MDSNIPYPTLIYLFGVHFFLQRSCLSLFLRILQLSFVMLNTLNELNMKSRSRIYLLLRFCEATSSLPF